MILVHLAVFVRENVRFVKESPYKVTAERNGLWWAERVGTTVRDGSGFRTFDTAKLNVCGISESVGEVQVVGFCESERVHEFQRELLEQAHRCLNRQKDRVERALQLTELWIAESTLPEPYNA